MAGTKWIVERWNGHSHHVRERETGEVIGSIIPYFQRAYMAQSHTGERRDGFGTRFDACQWLMRKHEQAMEAAGGAQ